MAVIQNPIIVGLADVCAEAFGFAIRFRASESEEDRDAVRQEIGAILTRMKDRGRREGIDGEALDHAAFAVVALVDEIAMTSDWSIQRDWAREPMQLALFRTTNAGDEFFERVEQVRNAHHPDRAGILEVFATCVALGFRGKYGTLDGVEQLRGLLGNLIDDARGGRAIPRSLSPASRPDRAADEGARRTPNWVYPVAAAALLVVLVALSHTWIVDALDELKDKLAQK